MDGRNAKAAAAARGDRALRARRGGHEGPAAPLAAIDIANHVGIRVGSDHESKRRGVRRIIDRLRDNGFRICADNEGYWLARDDAEWHAYQESRRRGARFEFVKIARMQRAANEVRSGQSLLPGENAMAWARN